MPECEHCFILSMSNLVVAKPVAGCVVSDEKVLFWSKSVTFIYSGLRKCLLLLPCEDFAI